MNEHFLILKRKFGFLSFFLIAMLLLAVLIGFNTPTRYSGTVVLTYALEDDQETDNYRYSNFYAEQAALEFTRTISGWYKDPSFTEHVFRTAELDYDEEISFSQKILGFFSTKRIERQNVSTGFSASSRENVLKIIDAHKRVIEHRLSAYNESALSKYVLAYEGTFVEENETPWSLLIITALFFAIFGGVFIAFTTSGLSSHLQFTREISKECEKEAYDILYENSTTDQRYFRMRMLNENPFGSCLSLNGKMENVLNGLDLETFYFPGDVTKLEEMKETILVVIGLGKSTAQEIKRMKQFLKGKKWEYIVVR